MRSSKGLNENLWRMSQFSIHSNYIVFKFLYKQLPKVLIFLKNMGNCWNWKLKLFILSYSSLILIDSTNYISKAITGLFWISFISLRWFRVSQIFSTFLRYWNRWFFSRQRSKLSRQNHFLKKPWKIKYLFSKVNFHLQKPPFYTVFGYQ